MFLARRRIIGARLRAALKAAEAAIEGGEADALKPLEKASAAIEESTAARIARLRAELAAAFATEAADRAAADKIAAAEAAAANAGAAPAA